MATKAGDGIDKVDPLKDVSRKVAHGPICAGAHMPGKGARKT